MTTQGMTAREGAATMLVVDGPAAGRIVAIPPDTRNWRILPEPRVSLLASGDLLELEPLVYRVETLAVPDRPSQVCPWCQRDHSTWLPALDGKAPALWSWMYRYRVLVLAYPCPPNDSIEVLAALARLRREGLPYESHHPWPCPRCPVEVRGRHGMPGRPLDDEGVRQYVFEYTWGPLRDALQEVDQRDEEWAP